MKSINEEQKILIVDDNAENIEILAAILKSDYSIQIALSGEKALEIAFEKSTPDIILLDIMMPKMDGFEVCRRLKENSTTKNIPVIFVTAMGEMSNEKHGFELGAVDYITKPVSPPIVKARVKTHLAIYDQNRYLEEKVAEKTTLLRKALDDLKDSSRETIYRLTQAADYRDEDTGDHIKRMSNYAVTVAEQMGINSTTLGWLLYSAPMHDVGKIGIPDKILLKPGKLTEEEWKIMKEHTNIGAKILKGSKAGYIRLGEVIALTHHEKWDGSGYPNGLKGRQIPLIGQIVAIADVFDALSTRRPYKEPFPLEKALQIIQEGSGSHFNPDVVTAFLASKEKILAIKDRFKGP